VDTASQAATQLRAVADNELLVKTNTTHGHARRGHKSSEYSSWNNMLQRCINSNNKDYAQYGGAGVEVCRRWLKLVNFLADMGPRPANTSLSRFGDMGNYVPSNCAWHTPKQQRAEAQKKRLRG